MENYILGFMSGFCLIPFLNDYLRKRRKRKYTDCQISEREKVLEQKVLLLQAERDYPGWDCLGENPNDTPKESKP